MPAHGDGAHDGAAHDGTAHDGTAPPGRMRMRLEMEVPSDVRYIEPIVAVVQRECAAFAFPPRHCALNVPVALSEALSNAILRGNREDPAKQVLVRARVDVGSLELEVEDQGSGFDLDASLRDPADPGNLEREDGRGLFLMRTLMDRVERYRHDDDGNNVVRLVLRRP